MTNPIDEVLQAKEAGAFGSMMQGAKRALRPEALGEAGARMAFGGAMLAAVPIAQKLYGAITKRRDFKEMMGVNPDLAEKQEYNPRLFNAAYNSLRRLNPAFGSDPVVAGAIMHKVMDSPGSAGLLLAESIGKGPQGNKPGEFMRNATSIGGFLPSSQDVAKGEFDLAKEEREQEKHPFQMEELQRNEPRFKMQRAAHKKNMNRD